MRLLRALALEPEARLGGVDLDGAARPFPAMTLIVDMNDWLEDGALPRHNLRLRRNAVRIASFIE